MSDNYKLIKLTEEILISAFKRIRDRFRSRDYTDLDSEDALQEAFCRIWGGMVSFSKIEDAEALLNVSVRNKKIDIARRRTRHPGVTLEGFDVAEYSEDEEFEDIFREVSRLIDSRLTEREKMILIHRDRYGWDYEDIAQELNLSEANVRLILSRTRKKIRDLYYDR